MNLRLLLTHINIQKTTDNFLAGNRDELYCKIFVLDTPPKLPGPSQYRCCEILDSVPLGSWGPTGSAKFINKTLYDGELKSKWDTARGLIVKLYDWDDSSADDIIGGVEIDCGSGVPVYRPLEHTRAFGETIPGSQDFRMEGGGAGHSYWFSCTVL